MRGVFFPPKGTFFLAAALIGLPVTHIKNTELEPIQKSGKVDKFTLDMFMSYLHAFDYGLIGLLSFIENSIHGRPFLVKKLLFYCLLKAVKA